MARKIAPALFYLLGKDALPARFQVVGFSRRDWSDDDLRAHVTEILLERQPDADPEAVERFCHLFTYQRGSFEDESAYVRALARLSEIDAEWGMCTNKLYYLAVPPEHYETIFRNIAASGLAKTCSDAEGWTRVLVEKPFGNDAKTSQALDELLASLFREEQIYRIDHYLAKEMLQGILNFRFDNNLFEMSWDRSAIERIDISLLETIGVEKRGRFYDGVGALRDVGQNHLLQMLALVTMDQPESLDPNAIRAARARLLESLLLLTAEDVARDTYRAAYRGYREIEGVAPDSDTETYFKLRTVLDGRRWAGVPVTMEGGKRIGTAPRKEIVVTFRQPPQCMCSLGQPHNDKVIFTLEPTEMIEIHFWAKAPGFEDSAEERTFDFFLYEKAEKAQYVEEYAKLLLDAIRGDQTLFVSTDEVRAMWRFVDPIVCAWRENRVQLEAYEANTDEAPRVAAERLASGVPQRGELGIVGLGKMGRSIARNALDHGWTVVGYNRTVSVAEGMAGEGLLPARTLAEFVAELRPPRVVWLMVPAGKPVDAMLFGLDGRDGLADLLEPGDIVIDGGNSFYKDALERSSRLAERGVGFLDAGTSGGPSGARHGACLMIGGDRALFEQVEPLIADLALPGGYRFFDDVGAGHFVKMVHNGIEYGMMQAIAEGFEVMHRSPYEFDLEQVADLYQHGSVIESRLMGWLADSFRLYGRELGDVSGIVGRTGEGEWTVRVAEEFGVDARVLADALRFRVESEHGPTFVGQILTAMRHQFGGHAVLSPSDEQTSRNPAGGAGPA